MSAPRKTKGVMAASRPVVRRDGHRRAEILHIARKLFAEKGFEATSIREIGDAAGILSGSLYYHFDTKEDMLQEIIKDYMGSLFRGYEKAAATIADPREALREMIRFGITEALAKREVHLIVVNERNFLARHPKFNSLEETWHDLFRIWYGVLQEGVRAGVFRREVNLHLALSIIMNSVNATIIWFRADGRFSIDEVLETQMGLLLRGLSVESKS